MFALANRGDPNPQHHNVSIGRIPNVDNRARLNWPDQTSTPFCMETFHVPNTRDTHLPIGVFTSSNW